MIYNKWLISSKFCRSHLLDEETEEDFITDILQEVVSSALDSIYHKIVQSRVIPYTVNAARELLLETIEVGCYLISFIRENNGCTEEISSRVTAQ